MKSESHLWPLRAMPCFTSKTCRAWDYPCAGKCEKKTVRPMRDETYHFEGGHWHAECLIRTLEERLKKLTDAALVAKGYVYHAKKVGQELESALAQAGVK